MFTKIAVATDGSPTAMRAVQVAADLAAKYESELIVLHVLMHDEPTESLKRMAIIEHIIDEESDRQIAYGDVPSQTILAARESHQSGVNEKLIATMGEKLVEQAKQKCREYGVSSVTGEILEGNYADKIVSAAKRTGADLIVLGARGLGPLEGLIKGSVSQKVARDADSTCLIVK